MSGGGEETWYKSMWLEDSQARTVAPHAWQPRDEEAMTIESSVGLSRLEPSKYARHA
jgi:hypothetical protein